MFNVGDLIIYSAQGICHIDDICEKTYAGVTKKYYILHPLSNKNLEISAPVDNDKVTMLKLMDRSKAEKIIESFVLPGIEWIDNSSYRSQVYTEIVKQGNPMDISKIANTLIRKKRITEANGKKLSEKDSRLLTLIQNILFNELAISLDTTYEAINDKVLSLINEYNNQ